jgi:hypothetical protein
MRIASDSKPWLIAWNNHCSRNTYRAIGRALGEDFFEGVLKLSVEWQVSQMDFVFSIARVAACK